MNTISLKQSITSWKAVSSVRLGSYLKETFPELDLSSLFDRKTDTGAGSSFSTHYRSYLIDD